MTLRTALPLILATIPALTVCGSSSVNIMVHNRLGFDRTDEIVELDTAALAGCYILTDSAGRKQPTQLTHDGKLLFAASVKAGSTATYTASPGRPEALPATCTGMIRPDVQDDFAWENDLGGYRLYGPSFRESGGKVFGYDIWTKSVTWPVLAGRYNDHTLHGISYHVDHGKGMDVYTVGPTLGAGMNALLNGDDIVWPCAYRTCEILDTGPLRTTARITCYPAKIGSDSSVVETRIISLDRGTWLNRTTVEYDGITSPHTIVAGIVIHRQNPDGYHISADGRTLCYTDLTDNPDNDNGRLHIGVIAPADSAYYRPLNPPSGDASGHIMTSSVYRPGDKFLYYWGAGWSKRGISDSDEWVRYMMRQRAIHGSPLTVTIVVKE